MSKKKLLLIGWDAADWKLIGPLIAKGQMPALKQMIDKGVYGNMATMNPPFSPMLWTSVATGKTPDKHGVLGFVEIMPDLQGVRPVSNCSRTTRAIWNILHNQGLKSNLVGWWPSYPAEPINGVVVSDKYQKVNADPAKRKQPEMDAIHPKSERDDFLKLRMFPTEITKAHILPFIPNAARINQDEDKLLKPFARIMSQNVSLHNCATRLLRTTEWDFMAVYHDMIDHYCHTFMKFHPPKQQEVDSEKFEMYKDVVNSAYRLQDMMLGRALDLIDEDTTVIVMSDHGFESGSKRILEMPKVNSAPAMEHREFGMFVAMGPNIKKNEKLFGAGLVDVGTTILHHFGLPIGRDMDGRVLSEIFVDYKEPKFIDSWDLMPGDFGELDEEAKKDVLSDQEAMDQLVELGYIQKPDLDKDILIYKAKCEWKHNLATVHLGLRQYNKAKELLLELIDEKEDLIDISVYYKDLVIIALAQKEYEAALNYFNKLKSIKTEVKYNLFFIEADILDGLNRTQEALVHLTNATNTKGHTLEFWRRIGALKYKLGDNKGALDSFEKAIEIEPDNAICHRNMAEVYYNLKEYDEAAEYALTSIELVNNFPEAHYILGRSLEKLGDLENAKMAYLTAANLKSISKAKELKAVENVEEKLEAITLNDKVKYKYRAQQIAVVSGLPRSGTSLMMQMLSKGGSTILTDENRKPDISNPKGYYEYDPVMSIHKDNSWLKEAQEKAVKIVGPLLKHLDSEYRYKIIFMKRDLNEIIKSQRVMTGKDPETLPVRLYNSYVRLLENIENWKERESNVEMIYIDYKEVLDKPEENIEKIIEFLGVNLDKEAMISCIDKKLYRNRVAH